MSEEEDGFGLDQEGRELDRRKREAEEKREKIRLSPLYPYVVEAPDLSFFTFPANPVPLRSGES